VRRFESCWGSCWGERLLTPASPWPLNDSFANEPKLARSLGAPMIASNPAGALLAALARETIPWTAPTVADALARLHPSPEQRAQARDALLALLAREGGPSAAGRDSCGYGAGPVGFAGHGRSRPRTGWQAAGDLGAPAALPQVNGRDLDLHLRVVPAGAARRRAATAAGTATTTSTLDRSTRCSTRSRPTQPAFSGVSRRPCPRPEPALIAADKSLTGAGSSEFAGVHATGQAGYAKPSEPS
jgi:hypothetical protein